MCMGEPHGGPHPRGTMRTVTLQRVGNLLVERRVDRPPAWGAPWLPPATLFTPLGVSACRPRLPLQAARGTQKGRGPLAMWVRDREEGHVEAEVTHGHGQGDRQRYGMAGHAWHLADLEGDVDRGLAAMARGPLAPLRHPPTPKEQMAHPWLSTLRTCRGAGGWPPPHKSTQGRTHRHSPALALPIPPLLVLRRPEKYGEHVVWDIPLMQGTHPYSTFMVGPICGDKKVVQALPQPQWQGLLDGWTMGAWALVVGVGVCCVVRWW